LVSVALIDPVASSITATFHFCETPCIDAVATAEILMVFFPNTAMNVVGMLADSVTCTAFAGEPVPQVVPLGMSVFRHFVDTLVVTVPR
jgi:hypothetical protein